MVIVPLVIVPLEKQVEEDGPRDYVPHSRQACCPLGATYGDVTDVLFVSSFNLSFLKLKCAVTTIIEKNNNREKIPSATTKLN